MSILSKNFDHYVRWYDDDVILLGDFNLYIAKEAMRFVNCLMFKNLVKVPSCVDLRLTGKLNKMFELHWHFSWTKYINYPIYDNFLS